MLNETFPSGLVHPEARDCRCCSHDTLTVKRKRCILMYSLIAYTELVVTKIEVLLSITERLRIRTQADAGMVRAHAECQPAQGQRTVHDWRCRDVY
jgi:hypothetical protein